MDNKAYDYSKADIFKGDGISRTTIRSAQKIQHSSWI